MSRGMKAIEKAIWHIENHYRDRVSLDAYPRRQFRWNKKKQKVWLNRG